MTSPRGVRAAGVVPVRERSGSFEVALVHRPKYDDWSWPKGKLDRGEDFASAAARETLEETGLRVRLGPRLPDVRYPVDGSQTKHVRYWSGEVIGGHGRLEHEIDEVAWLHPGAARDRLSYEHDRGLLDALLGLRSDGMLDSWPLLLVRHAEAVSRNNWGGSEPERPLSASGQRRARGGMAAVLHAYAPTRLLTSPSTRCVDSVIPYSQQTGVPLVGRTGLSEEGFETRPHKVGKHLRKLLAVAEPAAICTHRPLLPPLVSQLVAHAADDLDGAELRMLRRLSTVVMDKGEVLALTMLGAGEAARIVAVERHRPA